MASGGPAAVGTRSDLQSIIRRTARSQRVQHRARERFHAQGDSSKRKEEIKLTTNPKKTMGARSQDTVNVSTQFNVSFFNKCVIMV